MMIYLNGYRGSKEKFKRYFLLLIEKLSIGLSLENFSSALLILSFFFFFFALFNVLHTARNNLRTPSIQLRPGQKPSSPTRDTPQQVSNQDRVFLDFQFGDTND